MGSFLGTCAVTNLPIQNGEPVVGFLLSNAHGGTVDWNGYVAPGEVHQTISLQFEGTYEDYGSIEPTQSEVADILMRGLVGKTVPEVLEALSEGNDLTIDLGIVGGVSPIRLMMVHKDVWDLMTRGAKPPVRSPVEFASESSQHLEFLEFWAKQSKARMKELPSFWTRDADFYWQKATGRRAPFSWELFSMHRDGGAQPVAANAIQALLGERWDAGDKGGAQALMDHCLRFALFDENMTALRRLWMPAVGLGSQDYSPEIHAELAGWTAGKASAVELYADDYVDEEGPGMAAINKILAYGPRDDLDSDFLSAVSKIKLDRHDVMGMIHIADQALPILEEGDPTAIVLKRVSDWKRTSPAYDRHDGIGILGLCAEFKAEHAPAQSPTP